MLLNQTRPQAAGQVGIMTRSPEATRLLSAFLDLWKIPVTKDPTLAGLLLVEWGLQGVGSEDKLVWLTPLPLETGAYLELPLQLPMLSRCIEERFFSKARRQIRVPMDQPAEIIVSGRRLVSQLLSLSGRGARLTCAESFMKGQKLEIDLPLKGRDLHLSGEVLYTLPAGDTASRQDPQVGVLFRPIDLQTFEALCGFVECICLEQACLQAGLPLNAPCVSWVDVPRNPWSALLD